MRKARKENWNASSTFVRTPSLRFIVTQFTLNRVCGYSVFVGKYGRILTYIIFVYAYSRTLIVVAAMCDGY